MSKEDSIQQNDKKSNTIGNYYVLAVLGCGILFVVSIMLLNYFNILNLDSYIQRFSILSRQSLISPLFHTNLSAKCPVPMNLPIQNIRETKSLVTGNFQGFVKNVTFTITDLPAILTVTSLDRNQTVVFNMKLERDMLALLSTSPLSLPSNFHDGQKIFITFYCEVKTKGKFVIMNITALAP